MYVLLLLIALHTCKYVILCLSLLAIHMKLIEFYSILHLSPNLATTTKANRMYWMTDRSPHESLPLKAGTYRQFFRLVTSRVGLWFEDHSTPNPKGVKPDPKITKIVKGNKFSEDGVFVVVEQEKEEEEE